MSQLSKRFVRSVAAGLAITLFLSDPARAEVTFYLSQAEFEAAQAGQLVSYVPPPGTRQIVSSYDSPSAGILVTSRGEPELYVFGSSSGFSAIQGGGPLEFDFSGPDTAFGFTSASDSPFGVTLRLYDAAGNLLGQDHIQNHQATFLGVIATGGTLIARAEVVMSFQYFFGSPDSEVFRAEYSSSAIPVPEPTTTALLASAVPVGLFVAWRRRRRAAPHR